MVGRKVALAQRALRSRHGVQLVPRLRHQPARQDRAARRALRPFQHTAIGGALLFLARHAGDHDHRGFRVEEHLLREGAEGVAFHIVLQAEAHVPRRFGIAEVQRDAVGIVRLHVDDEELALLAVGFHHFSVTRLELLVFADLERVAAMHAVGGEQSGAEAHRGCHVSPTAHVQLLRVRRAPFHDEVFDLLLLVRLRTGNELLVGNQLRRDRAVYAHHTIAFTFADPHGSLPHARRRS